MAEYSRPPGFRFAFLGVNTRSRPDALQPGKYTYAQNVRGVSNNSITTRPGYVTLLTTGGNPITDIGSYAALETDDIPRFLCRDKADKIWMDPNIIGVTAGVLVGTMASGGGDGASLIPYRPNQSPEPWMYISTQTDYQKFSAPDISNAVTQYKVGIAEPQAPPDACPDAFYYQDFTALATDWTQGGTAGAPSDGGPTDTVVAVFVDPASAGVTPRYSVQVHGSIPYRPGMTLTIGLDPITHGVQDVLPAINTTAGLTVLAIYYFAGTTGRCVVVTDRIPVSGSVPTFNSSGISAASIFGEDSISALRRGSLIQFSGGSEICFVLSVTTGPAGNLCFEVSTTGTHAVAETLKGIPAITLSNITPAVVGSAIAAADIEYAITAGTGTLDQSLSVNPFNAAFNFATTPPSTAQDQDYLSLLIQIDDLTQFVLGTIIFDVNNGSATFVDNAFYYDFDLSSVISQITTGLNVLPSNLWIPIKIPISSLIRLGSDATRTLANTQAVRISIQTLGNINVAISSILVGGGSEPDVGTGSPYFYILRPRSSVTGARGNPSAVTRYGVSPIRQRVIVICPTTYSDPQMDTWDIFRYGGSVTSFRYVGSLPLSAGVFFDNFFDTAVEAGDVIDYSNFEPWPTIDLPFNATSGTVAGVTTEIRACGTTTLVIYSSSNPFTSPMPATFARWLPGTLAIIGGSLAFTMWNRPVSVSLTVAPNTYYFAYLFQFVEDVGYGDQSAFSIVEPNLARQILPYIWGPDAFGTLFACGDQLRPGTLYWCNKFNPDSASDANNQEVTNPSEPLLGGEIIDGVALVGSSKRWFRVIPQLGNLQNPYQVVELPVGRGLAAPYGHCTDGRTVFFVAKDGIWSTETGSLTDEDLYNLFPHEGVPGEDVASFSGTMWAPDYTRVSDFRLSYCNSYLYFDYQNSFGTAKTLVCDLRTGAWAPDVYNHFVRVHYAPPQQEAPVLDDTSGLIYPALVLGDVGGKVWKQKALANDGGLSIICYVLTPEWDAGDLRSSEQWGDMELDCVPAAQGLVLPFPMTITPVSAGAQASTPINPTMAAVRTQEIISLAGGILKRYLGMLIAWNDDFGLQSVPTTLYIWQPSYILKPETIADRAGDWDDGGTTEAKFFQGFELHADTFNVAKSIKIQDADSQALHVIQPATVQHNGEQTKAYSFATPFVAHLVRDVPQDQIAWRRFGFKYIWQPTPESVQTWITQGTAFGQTGYQHIKAILAAYAATADVTLTITVYDGTSPAAITLPSTGGAYRKVFFPLTFNKGLLYFFSGVSAANWTPYLSDWEIMVGQWGRPGSYMTYKNIGGERGDQARI